MKQTKLNFMLLLALCLLLAISGCRAQTPVTTEATETIETTEAAGKREPVASLQCIQTDALSSLYPVSGAQVAVSWEDYENERTRILLVDVNQDTVCREISLDGV